MNGSDLVEAVQTATKTELSRLGSSKSLYADTEGEMESDAVLTAAADNAHHAAETFEGWADDDVEGAFADATEAERDHYESIAGKLDDHEPGTPPAVVEFIRGLPGVVERLGGLVGWTLVTEEKASQCTGFFTGQADPQTASLFRGFGDNYEATREGALDALEAACENEGDWERAETAATSAVEAAYDEYFETLEDLGVNPKPVC
ncbi:rubrerythrin family protein [Salinibaculum rarum]|uniref:rubrerythrin family protein n=1 Tax=Salinibaculum rarum TaxID=3058903 RepID=UPI00265DCF1E|nr:rubrerythrin family protein [Salinibaculum sp. KK48]